MNVHELVRRLNIVRKLWAKPMVITSGLRTDSDQARINPKATRSAHLEGRAADISDPNGELYAWLKKNPDVLSEANLYAELDTKGWVHLQSRAFGSYKPGGTRWFKA